jgi:predicted kinase
MLIVFSGLPGTGKTTLARALAVAKDAAYRRIDVIEQAIRNAEPDRGEVGPIGYDIALALADSNLLLQRIVVVDCVNPVSESRAAWDDLASRHRVHLHNIEVICTDPDEHRRRVEGRQGDIVGLKLPTWPSVLQHEYEPWATERFIVDTATQSFEDSLQDITTHIDR